MNPNDPINPDDPVEMADETPAPEGEVVPVGEVEISGEGSVAAPPSIGDIAQRLSEAAQHKVEIILSPGEARVLSDYLGEGLE